jgi:hypothetical protein
MVPVYLQNIKNHLASDMVDQNPQLHNSETSKLAILKQIHHTYGRCLKFTNESRFTFMCSTPLHCLAGYFYSPFPPATMYSACVF